MKHQRIAFISEHASPLAIIGNVDSGGQNIYVAELCKKLGACGYEVDIFTRKDDAAQSEIIALCHHVRVVHITAGPETFIEKEQLLPHMQEFAGNMLRFINKQPHNYDLMHANFFMSALVASKVKAQTGIPYTVTFHALGLVRKAYQKEADRFPIERIAIEQMIVKDADSIIAECPEDKNDLMTFYDADPAKITIIPCGFSDKEFSPVNKALARRRIGVNEEDKIILQLGRMVPRKGIDNVIRALAKLADKEVKLLVVGGDYEGKCLRPTAEMQRLLNIAKEEGVADRVIFTGRKGRRELKYYYAAADIFITTPWYEPFGITPLEAMACGTPVIGADVGGIKYSVKDGVTGFLIPSKNPQALSEKIELLLGNPSLMQQMQAACIARVNKLFTWARVADAVSTHYHALLKEPAARASYSLFSLNMQHLNDLIATPVLAVAKGAGK